MTIEQYIRETIDTLKTSNPTLYTRAEELQKSIEKIIEALDKYLGDIAIQMQEYDNHDADHSRKVLENIEKILQKRGICDLTLLEAMVLRLCCYFHDSGMILPQCYLPMIEDIERDPLAELPASLLPRLAELKKPFKEVEKEFFCPKDERKYEKFLREQLEGYRKYRLGLAEELSGPEQHIRTRHTYFRMTHGERSGAYAQNLERFLKGLNTAGRQDLAKAVEEICSAHCWDYGKVRKMQADMKVKLGEPQMCGNKRYLAMLLRLGDLLHFSGERASRTVYAMRPAMTPDSDIHWRAKLAELEYEIKEDGGKLCIAFSAGFEEPKAYYFLQEYLNWVDEELRSYVFFQADMKGRPDAARYELGLPEKVDRSGIRYDKFRPAEELKFKLEHQKIIQLLMGMRLYRDEFMCLRELYQNALDACRCMREVNRSKGLEGELRIEFGLGSDEGGDYLYCRDQGTGMTEEIIKKYLLRIGNSYYQSDEFRRANALWGGAVAPVSEFGIGLLSCYMIASRIEVITRHHTKTAEPPIWICMEGSSDQGYYRDPGDLEPGTIGEHGTCVKLYLQEKYKPMVTDYLPEDVRDAVYMLEQAEKQPYVRYEEKMKEILGPLEPFRNSLYHQIQRFVHIPEAGIPVEIRSAAGLTRLFSADEPYHLGEKLPMLLERGFPIGLWIEQAHPNSPKTTEDAIQRLRCFEQIPCIAEDPKSRISAGVRLVLPVGQPVDWTGIGGALGQKVSGRGSNTVYIDGMAVNNGHWAELYTNGISYRFSGKLRPSLTVDRGDIRSVGAEIPDVLKQLREQLSRKIAAEIRAFYAERPEVLTDKTKEFLFWYFRGYFDSDFALWILMDMARDLLRDHRHHGVALWDWFYGKGMTLSADILTDWGDILVRTAVSNANGLQLQGGNVKLDAQVTEKNIPRYRVGDLVVYADNWPEGYEQYDSLGAYPGMVPRHVWELIPENSDADIGRVRWFNGVLPADYPSDPIGLSYPEWWEVLIFLQEEAENHPFHSVSITCLPPEENKKYVLYRYLAPRPLTEEDEAFLKRYCDRVPKYREGVEKGWSILYYEWANKTGYVIAPGIVDRKEILNLLPREVKERTDGSEYYFTDGERAF